MSKRKGNIKPNKSFCFPSPPPTNFEERNICYIKIKHNVNAIMKIEKWLIVTVGETIEQPVRVFKLTQPEMETYPELAQCKDDRFGVYKTHDFSGKAYWKIVHENGSVIMSSNHPERMRDILDAFPGTLALNIRIAQNRHNTSWDEVKANFEVRKAKIIEQNGRLNK